MGETDYSAWLGRIEQGDDVVTAAPLRGLAALLDKPIVDWYRGRVPQLGHWLYFLPQARQSMIGEDGHPQRGDFLPPVALPRRMWAGGKVEFLKPLHVGNAVQRISTIVDVKSKTGRSGQMVFVSVRHDVMTAGDLAIRERQDIVYLEPPKPGAAGAAPAPAAPAPAAASQREITSDPVLLFRYSALTFNGHRIHYDRTYCQNVEGYPGLVVHGPLLATLLQDFYVSLFPDAVVASFDFKSLAPIFDTEPFMLHAGPRGRETEVWASRRSGQIGMKAIVTTAG